jgi:hypothetical protein
MIKKRELKLKKQGIQKQLQWNSVQKSASLNLERTKEDEDKLSFILLPVYSLNK